MTLNEFVTKYKGKGIDFDGHFGFQCVDLYRQYVQEVLEVPQSPGVTGAKDIWTSYLPEHFDRILNTPEGIPQAGDIMIWGSDYGQYGHVAVVISATINTITCFSQNDPLGTLSIIKKYLSYNGVLGWLHPKEKEVNNEQILKDKISDLETKMATLNEAMATKSLEVNNLRTELEAQERDNKDLSTQLIESRKEREQFKAEKEACEIKSLNLQKAIEVANAELNVLKSQINDLELTIKELKQIKLSDVNTGLLIQELFHRLFRK
jgi:chaperonin cofactor prefoldin